MVHEGGSWSGHETDCAYLNLDGRSFADVSHPAGLDDPGDGRGTAVVDWDGDGALDLWRTNRTGPMLQFHRNTPHTRHHFLSLRLEGRGGNRDAVGARVRLVTDCEPAATFTRTVRAGEGYLSQSSKSVHFGLGECDRIARAEVEWPNGNRETFTGLETNRRYRLDEGGEPRLLAARRVRFESDPTLAGAPSATQQTRMILTAPVDAPPLTYVVDDGKASPLNGDTGRSRLVVAWASWCPNCLVELAGLKDRQGDINAAAVDVIALTADEPDTRPDAAAHLRRIDWPFRSGVPDADTVNLLDALQQGLLERHERMPLPCSFLFDGRGRLQAIYKGPVDPSTVLADVMALGASDSDRLDRAVPWRGRWLKAPGPGGLMPLVQRFWEMGYTDQAAWLLRREGPDDREGFDRRRLAAMQMNIATSHLRDGRLDDAIGGYGEAVRLDPESPDGYRNLAAALSSAGRFDEAAEQFQRADAAFPLDAEARAEFGRCLAQLGRFEDAGKTLQQALADAPDHETQKQGNDRRFVSTNFNLALILARDGRPDDALRHCERAQELDPAHFDSRAYMGVIHLQTGAYGEAVVNLRQALEIQPAHESTLYNLAVACLKTGDSDCAAEQKRRLETIATPRALELAGNIVLPESKP